MKAAFATAGVPAVAAAMLSLAEIVDGTPVPTFVIDGNHVVTHWNRALEALVGVPAADMIGTSRHWLPFYAQQRPVLADFVVDGKRESVIDSLYRGRFRRAPDVAGAFEGTDFFPQLGSRGKWLHFTATPLRDTDGRVIAAIERIDDISEQKFAADALRSA